ncbi:hypothetical protein FE782_16670 [Paenibacillus antri]|uniref:Uncharacterized protein n=1 Tax=Paenibacillus antri TaxID=2582848 RepID=A0A5R9GHR5_9BACL|nr:hypothetical protein [Paenibacillus antri]TLS51025.1 hypothetical protein FE782_16670 [Paenibacillus antri]
MLDFERKLAVFSSFPELVRKDVSLGRVNFHYEQSVYEKKTVGFHLHPNGNGYVYAALIPGAETDPKGFVNVRDASEDELREWIAASIRSLSSRPDGEAQAAAAPTPEPQTAAPAATESRWTNDEGQTLRLTFEDDLWYVFAGQNLESAFETYDEAEAYMREEGFRKQP